MWEMDGVERVESSIRENDFKVRQRLLFCRWFCRWTEGRKIRSTETELDPLESHTLNVEPYTHTHTHTHTHTLTHTQTHTHIHAHMYTHTHSHLHIHKHVHVHCTHIQTHTSKYTCMPYTQSHTLCYIEKTNQL